ncbi:MAG: hypothetical protein ACK57X_12985 [Bacteroidota bacterium]
MHISNYEITFDEGIKLSSGKTVSYAGNPDWRLIEYDDFTSDTEGWTAVAAWNNATAVPIQRFSPGTPFSKGFIIRPNADASSSAAPALVKEFNLTNIPHTSVKVVFTYHFFDSWDYALSTSSGSRHEFGYGAFSTGFTPTETGGQFQVGWRTSGATSTFDSFFSKAGYTNLTGSSAKFSDHNIRGSMVAETTDNRILIYFGSNLNGPLTDESFGISNVEIWVK